MRWLVLALVIPLPALAAESLVATRPIAAGTLLAHADLTTVAALIPGALADPADAVGKEARRAIPAGRPIRAEDVAAPAVVERNQIVPLRYRMGGLSITTEGRALARGEEGAVIRVMNLGSRSTVSGRVLADGSIQVGGATQ